MAQHGHSEACCNVPPAQADYKEKGSYITVDGMKIYKTGPSTATSAILFVFDIFGYCPQTLQGADILAHADDSSHQYQVFMPDFFHGKPADPAWVPPDTPEKGQKLGEFIKGPASAAVNVPKIPSLVREITKKSGGTIQKWGAVGLCWGGKVVILSSGPDAVFTAIATAHPSMVDPKDAEALTVPICMLASKDEPKDAVSAFQEALKVPGQFETFADQPHGWMAARAGLENTRSREEYERGYKTLLGFFHKYL